MQQPAPRPWRSSSRWSLTLALLLAATFGGGAKSCTPAGPDEAVDAWDGAGPDAGGAPTDPGPPPPVEDPGDEPGDQPGDEPGDQPGDQPGDEPGDQPGDDPGDEPGDDPVPPPPAAPSRFPHAAGFPAPNEYSWNGSFCPRPADFPLAGLFDDEYGDGHQGTPILPPGQWDWNDANNDLANWRAFRVQVGEFAELLDAAGNHFGWELLGNTPAAIPFNGPAHYFDGSPGVDLLHLGPGGRINSDTAGSLGDGPDVLVFDEAWSLDFRTGSSLEGGAHDDDLVIGGCRANGPAAYGIFGASIHTGPGADTIYVRDARGAALDAGNGRGGVTSALDPLDGDDLVVLRGNMKDFRVFGGAGDDVVVWYVQELGESIAYAGPNFFGAGGSGDALWDTAGTDRLVLVLPPTTRIVGGPPARAGELMVTHYYGNLAELTWDQPTYGDERARYCITCGRGPDGRKTLNLEYRAPDGTTPTGWFWVTNFEELQLGDGPDAAVYRIDQATARVTPAPDLAPYRPAPWPDAWCEASTR
jgi:hypothetical protein